MLASLELACTCGVSVYALCRRPTGALFYGGNCRPFWLKTCAQEARVTSTRAHDNEFHVSCGPCISQALGKKKRCCCSWWCIRAVPPSTALFFLVPHLFLSSSLPLSLSSSLPLCLSWKPIVPSSLPLIRSSSLHLFLCSCLPLFLSSSVSSFLSSALPLFLYSSVPLFLPSSQEAATNTHTCRDAVDGRASLRSHHQLHCCFALPPVGSCGRCLFSQCPSTPRHAQSPLTPRHAPNPNTPRHAQCPIKPRHTQCMHGCQS